MMPPRCGVVRERAPEESAAIFDDGERRSTVLAAVGEYRDAMRRFVSMRNSAHARSDDRIGRVAIEREG
jgi:hypothetical protein